MYTKYYQCSICGHTETTFISPHGDYDSPDKPAEITNCPICAVLNETSPKLFARLKLQANKINQQQIKIKEIQKAVHELLYITDSVFPLFRCKPLFSIKYQAHAYDKAQTALLKVLRNYESQTTKS